MDGLPLFGDVPSSLCSKPLSGDILLGDGMDALRSLEAGSVACIVTDPPYGIAYHSNYYKDKNPHAPIAQDWNVQIGAYLAAAERTLRPGGAVYMFTRFDVFPLWAREVPPSLSLKECDHLEEGQLEQRRPDRELWVSV